MRIQDSQLNRDTLGYPKPTFSDTIQQAFDNSQGFELDQQRQSSNVYIGSADKGDDNMIDAADLNIDYKLGFAVTKKTNFTRKRSPLPSQMRND